MPAQHKTGGLLGTVGPVHPCPLTVNPLLLATAKFGELKAQLVYCPFKLVNLHVTKILSKYLLNFNL
jgi:hypothetical protein